jgi:hypothetical protein
VCPAVARLPLALIDGYDWQGQLLSDVPMLADSVQLARVVGRAIEHGEFDRSITLQR